MQWCPMGSDHHQGTTLQLAMAKVLKAEASTALTAHTPTSPTAKETMAPTALHSSGRLASLMCSKADNKGAKVGSKEVRVGRRVTRVVTQNRQWRQIFCG